MKYHYSVDMETDNSLSVILRHIDSESKVFEFGPADGYMTEVLKNTLNCEVYCLEIDKEAAEKAEKYCDKMIVADLNRLDWLDNISDQVNSFDFLIFADVLEHLIDPEKTLSYLTKKLLKDDGKVLISLPHIGHTAVILELLTGKFEYRETGLLDRTHLRFFTRDSVLKLLNSAGLHPTNWYNICMYPEQTELSIGYNVVPIEVQEFLKNKVDAHVYQFVVCAEKGDNYESSSTKPVEVSSYRYSRFVQLFWNTGDGYSEKKSLRLPLENEGSYRTYCFEFKSNEEKLVRFIRLDPINFSGYVHLRSFKVFGLNRKTNQFEVIVHDEITSIYGAEISKNSYGVNVFVYNDDPQLQIELDEIGDYGAFRVEVELCFYSKIDPHLINIKQQDFDKGKVDNKLQSLSEISSEILKSLQTSNEVKEEISKLRAKINQAELYNFQLQLRLAEIILMNNELNEQVFEVYEKNCLLEKLLDEEKEKNKTIERELTYIKESSIWKFLSIFNRKRTRDKNRSK